MYIYVYISHCYSCCCWYTCVLIYIYFNSVCELQSLFNYFDNTELF